MTKTYSELLTIPTYAERFEYLQLFGIPGEDVFGPTRWVNQEFYSSYIWKKFRRDIIIRDDGCDMAFPNCNIQGKIYVHHITQLKSDDILRMSSKVLDPENVVCVSFNTHNAIHYGDINLLNQYGNHFIERAPNDTIPWRQ